MKLGQLTHFLAVADCGSIREAARRIGLSQPALSKSLRQLELDLKGELFTRSRSGVAITAAGRQFATRARAVVSELRRAREEVEGGGGRGTPHVAIGLGQTVIRLVLPEAYRRFRARWPEARVRFVEGLPDNLLTSLRAGALDFVIGGRIDNPPTGLAFKPLYRSARVVAVRVGHPLAEARSAAALTGAEWVDTPPIQDRDGPIRTTFVIGGHAMKPPVAQCNSYHLAASLLASSDLLALVPRRQLSMPFEAVRLREIPLRDAIPAFTVGMYLREDTPLTPAAGALARVMTTEARRLTSTQEY